MKFVILLSIMLTLSACSSEDTKVHQSCKAYPDLAVTVSVEQMRTIWQCFTDKELVVEGYLKIENSEYGFYYLFDSLDAAEHWNQAKQISIFPTKSVAEQIISNNSGTGEFRYVIVSGTQGAPGQLTVSKITFR